jgi:hypothetical protein
MVMAMVMAMVTVMLMAMSIVFADRVGYGKRICDLSSVDLRGCVQLYCLL